MNAEIKDKITLGAGCFWCVESFFSELGGVISVQSGYAGGILKNPSYQEICTGKTGHAEVCQITYDLNIISLEKLLEVFWAVHDPTTLNKQGKDIGTQYRSVIFFHSTEQKDIAEKIKSHLNESKVFKNPIVTEITAFATFYPAENYHNDYFKIHGNEPYCSLVIKPKLNKFKTAFRTILKLDSQ